jgi:Xaa-Pro aminopeptidase
MVIMMQNQTRLDNLRKILIEKQIDAMWVSQPDNLFYLSGCEGMEGYLLISRQQAVMVTDFRYVEQAQRQSPHYELFRLSGKMADWLPRLFSGRNISNLGFESSHMAVSTFDQINDILKTANVKMLPQNGLIEGIRTVKDKSEVEKIIRAARITDAVYDHVEAVLRPGLTELGLAWEIEKFMRDNGSQPVPFELIVAAGPNSALPHAKPSNYVIKSNEPIVIDIGSKVEYYGSDLTRTVYIGKPDETFKKVYSTVLEAQQTAIAGIKPGMTGAEADALARQVITKAGYGDAFGHSLGHGIGLVTHEKPTVGPNSTEILSEGMVFTVEPGIYISGWGGVRIEDDVVIENGKLRVISSGRKMKV